MTPLRAAWRSLRALLHVLSGLWTLRRRFDRLSPAQRQGMVQAWSRQLLAIMGVDLTVRGTPPAAGPLLVVSNHISWLDIMVLNAAAPARFVSKADVKRWPLLGALIGGAGTLFIERESRRDAMRVVHHMADALRQGDVVAVFPEGTTGNGQGVLPFHANLLQAAVSAPAPVQPVGLAYVDGRTGQRSEVPVYVGDTTLVASLWRTLGASGLQAVVSYGEVQPALGQDRRAWALALHAAVSTLKVPGPGVPGGHGTCAGAGTETAEAGGTAVAGGATTAAGGVHG
jgi:1-acyl-sn-glycerol-3-phosphate acyltransferase